MNKRNLKGRIVLQNDLDPAMIGGMHSLMAEYFEVEYENFAGDLARKDKIIVLEDQMNRIQGFTSILFVEINVHGQPIRALFSGDTIVRKDYWGSLELPKIWSGLMFEEIKAAHDKLLYWFLISSGYRTYRFLPVFFLEFYPCFNKPTPTREKNVLHSLGTHLFGARYNPESGVILMEHPTPLKPGVSDISREKLNDPHIAFFSQKNPGHINGDELACLAPLTLSNLGSFTRKFLKGLLRKSVS